MTPEELGKTLGRMEQKLDDQTVGITRLETKVDYTNGRVRGLEVFKARVMTLVALGLVIGPIVAAHFLQ